MLTIKEIEDSSFRLAHDQVGDLLDTIKASDNVSEAYSTTWFKVYGRMVQDAGPYNMYAAKKVISNVDKILYPMVKDRFITPEMDAIERNKATTFHRTAKHLVTKAYELHFVGGMDEEIVDPAKMTRGTVRKTHAEWKERTTVSDPVADATKGLRSLTKKVRMLEKQGVDTSTFWDLYNLEVK